MWLRHKETERFARFDHIDQDLPDTIVLVWQDGDEGPAFGEISEFEVRLTALGWVDLAEAISDHDLITDRSGLVLFEPTNTADRARGSTTW